MAWTTPLTAVTNTALTAAQWNLSVRDNLNETAPAKATAGNRIFVTTGPNTIAERRIVDNVVETSETTTSTTYDDLATVGPQVSSLTTGSKAFVFINSHVDAGTSGQGAWASWGVTGATTSAPIDGRAVVTESTTFLRAGVSTLIDLTAGSNTFTMRYRTSNATSTAAFQRRRMQVMAL